MDAATMQIPPPPKTDSERRHLREHFLEPEIRCGTEVSVRTKEVWKCMLDMLEEFIRVCDKYGLKWSVASGTLLGAVRHGGFIPWDEDLDVAMPRKDFNKFLKVAPKEFSHPYMLQTWTTDRDVFQIFARLRNSETASILDWYASHHWKCNMGIFIDIYTIEGIPGGRLAHRLYNRALRVVTRMRWQSMDPPAYQPFTFKDRIRKIVFRVIGVKVLFKILNTFTSWFTVDNCLMVGLTPFHSGIWTNGMVPARYFESYKTVDFEYLRVKVPERCEQVLGAYYGNWTKFVKGACGHDGNLVVDPHRSYREVLPERFAKYGYSAADFKDDPWRRLPAKNGDFSRD